VTSKPHQIPFIDIFAGPGGLGEGFSTFKDPDRQYCFKSVLSIEKEEKAHQTLQLRSFFRQFREEKYGAPEEYYEYLRDPIDLAWQTLEKKFPDHIDCARKEAHCIELGGKGKANSPKAVSALVEKALGKKKFWGLLGGPPCQAYSVIGRSRMGGISSSDHRVFLYKEYLRILAQHAPAFFVFENVRGIISSDVNGENVFERVRADLENPQGAFPKGRISKGTHPEYTLFSFEEQGSDNDSDAEDPRKFLVKAELHGIPQARHRVILLGINNKLLKGQTPEKLKPEAKAVTAGDVLAGLPELRSGLSKGDNARDWSLCILEAINFLKESNYKLPAAVARINSADDVPIPTEDRGDEFVPYPRVWLASKDLKEWYLDSRVRGVLNHATRGHLQEDLCRYMLCSVIGAVSRKSPKLKDFPADLMPHHKSAGTGKFEDRFRVQLRNRPSTTITSHISKDGHYFIHPDPLQCRSLTVREAARLQSFPDNYFFCGPRTSQYLQVGNAVPPLLAHQMAEVIYDWAARSGLVS
jgi:DNA (cytosine-5)-methyltransferase 1